MLALSFSHISKTGPWWQYHKVINDENSAYSIVFNVELEPDELFPGSASALYLIKFGP